jgi:hypothetical protein
LKIAEICAFTVFSESPSSIAIVLFDAPSHTRRSTSICRSVKTALAELASVGGTVDRVAAASARINGGTYNSPFKTSRIAEIRVFWLADFGT